MAVRVDEEKCTGCGTCEEACPVEAIKVTNYKAKIDAETFIECGACVEECPEEALSMEPLKLGGDRMPRGNGTGPPGGSGPGTGRGIGKGRGKGSGRGCRTSRSMQLSFLWHKCSASGGDAVFSDKLS